MTALEQTVTGRAHNGRASVTTADAETFGMPEQMETLKREVLAGCARFWAKRGMKEPGQEMSYAMKWKQRKGEVAE